jgi:hypothetical protein
MVLGHVRPVGVLVMLPLVGRLGDVADFAAAAVERLAVLRRDAFLRKVLAPRVEQAGVDDAT